MRQWTRLWHDMPTDPKWRVIAKKSKRPLTEVISVFMLMLTSATDDGAVEGWAHEDAAAALDLEPDHVEAIWSAMQGKVLDETNLTGWRKRQPKREDDSKDRVRAFRERKKRNDGVTDPMRNAIVTQRNAPEENREETEKSSAVAREPAREAAPKIDMDRLIQACNGALDNPVNCLGLLTAGTPMMWLESGCDLERDVIPTLEALGKKHHGKRIRSWDYFSNAIVEARDKRKAGLPPPKFMKAEQRPAYAIPSRPREKTHEELVAEVEAMGWA